MNTIELLELINKGEGYHLEFKHEEENNEDFAKTIVCFANTDGGKILIGVDDTGRTIGVSDIDKLMLRMDDIALNRCDPPVIILQESINIDGKNVVIVNVEKGSQRPYRTKSGHYYIRSSNRCRQATREELLRIFQSAKSLFYDEIPINNSKLTDLDISSFKFFLRKYLNIETNNEEKIINYLCNFHLLEKESLTPTFTGILFFANNPQNFVSESRIVCANIEGTDISQTDLETKNLTGKISDIINNVEIFFKLSLRNKHRIKDFQPESEYEIPLTALREAIVNAIAHRDYTINAPIRVLIFTNRVEIRSPGRLPNTVTVESIKVGGSHVLRNPTIYNMLLKMGLVTDLGSGVRRIIKLVKEHLNKDVEFENTENEFIIKIPRKTE
ncbi:MAG: putative DNA binding domain-containing protein [Bacteroidales bacterium]|nr:putative DNA binding domain-containing protein [Bacteroidales bacterium]